VFATDNSSFNDSNYLEDTEGYLRRFVVRLLTCHYVKIMPISEAADFAK
jgi:hypothetical protein